MIGEVTASEISPPSTWMPAFASANRGTIAKLVHGVQPVLEALVGRDRRRDAELGGAGQLGCGLLAERAGQLRDPLEVRARGRVGARGEADRQPRDQRLDPGFEQRHPHRHRRERRERRTRHATGA